MEYRFKTTIVALVLVFALVLAGCAQSANQTTQPDTTTQQTQPETNDDDTMMEEDMMSDADITFVLTGTNFAFWEDEVEAPELRVNVGDTVRIEFSSTQGFHDWVVDEFDAATEKVRETDGSTYVEFVADEAGTFEYYCSVGSHRANGMVGNLIVE